MSQEMVQNLAKEIATAEKLDEKRGLDFMGMVPCPIKPGFAAIYDQYASRFYAENKREILSYVPLSCGCAGHDGERQFFDILGIPSIELFPKITAAFSFMDFFHSEFQSRFFGKGYFQTLDLSPLNKDFEGLGLSDPDGDFNIYSAFPAVIMVDKRKLGDLPVPKSFADLLNPVYKGQITIQGGHGSVSALFPMYILKEFGEAGLEALDKNVGNVIHGTKMAKIAGTMNSEGTAIYVIYWFFAKTCAATQYVDIIWPEDGAYMDPMYILAKKDIPSELNILLDMLRSKEMSTFLSENYFPCASTGIDNQLPAGAKMKWIGWDFLKSHKIEELVARIEKQFDKHIRPENR